jgi:hypothetical protein
MTEQEEAELRWALAEAQWKLDTTVAEHQEQLGYIAGWQRDLQERVTTIQKCAHEIQHTTNMTFARSLAADIGTLTRRITGEVA